jgi:hypothetical protein
MNEILRSYLSVVRQKYATGVARERACRSPLEQLLRQLNNSLTVINDPARIAYGYLSLVLISEDRVDELNRPTVRH